MIDTIQKDAVRLTALSVMLLIIMKVLFFNESLSVLLRFVASLIWLYVLPGFVMMYIWRTKLDFLTRIIAGTAAGFALISTLSYYTGMIGIHVRYHSYFLPPLMMGVVLIIVFKARHK